MSRLAKYSQVILSSNGPKIKTSEELVQLWQRQATKTIQGRPWAQKQKNPPSICYISPPCTPILIAIPPKYQVPADYWSWCQQWGRGLQRSNRHGLDNGFLEISNEKSRCLSQWLALRQTNRYFRLLMDAEPSLILTNLDRIDLIVKIARYPHEPFYLRKQLEQSRSDLENLKRCQFLAQITKITPIEAQTIFNWLYNPNEEERFKKIKFNSTADEEYLHDYKQKLNNLETTYSNPFLKWLQQLYHCKRPITVDSYNNWIYDPIIREQYETLKATEPIVLESKELKDWNPETIRFFSGLDHDLWYWIIELIEKRNQYIGYKDLAQLHSQTIDQINKRTQPSFEKIKCSFCDDNSGDYYQVYWDCLECTSFQLCSNCYFCYQINNSWSEVIQHRLQSIQKGCGYKIFQNYYCDVSFICGCSDQSTKSQDDQSNEDLDDECDLIDKLENRKLCNPCQDQLEKLIHMYQLLTKKNYYHSQLKKMFEMVNYSVDNHFNKALTTLKDLPKHKTDHPMICRPGLQKHPKINNDYGSLLDWIPIGYITNQDEYIYCGQNLFFINANPISPFFGQISLSFFRLNECIYIYKICPTFNNFLVLIDEWLQELENDNSDFILKQIKSVNLCFNFWLDWKITSLARGGPNTEKFLYGVGIDHDGHKYSWLPFGPYQWTKLDDPHPIFSPSYFTRHQPIIPDKIIKNDKDDDEEIISDFFD